MQVKLERRSNIERSETMRTALLTAARSLFAERHFGDVGTPEIVERAAATRGALYHHFADKEALFAAVVEAEAEAVAEETEKAAGQARSARQAFSLGSQAYLAAMTEPGRIRLLLLDGPSVLGRAHMEAVENRHGSRSLREGLAAILPADDSRLDALTALLGAAYDRAAVDIAAGRPREAYCAALEALVDGLAVKG